MAGIAALALAYVLSQFYRTFLAVLTPALAADIGATNTDLSIASGAWFVALALMQFAVGVSLDRYGPRLTTTLLMLVGGAGAFLFAFATQPWMVIVAMALIGVGCSPILMAAMYIFARDFSPARFAVLSSWIIAFGSAGNVIGTSPLANAVAFFGWREVMAGFGAVTVVIALALFATIREPRKPAGHAHDDNGLAGYLELMKLKALWPILPLVGFHLVAAAGIRGLWAGPYLSEVYGADAILIGRVTLFMAFAMVAGAFLYGPLDTLLNTRKWLAAGGSAIGVAALTYLVLDPAPGLVAATVIFVVIGLFGGIYGVLMAHGRAFVPPRLIGRGVTLLNFFAIGVVGITQFAAGAVYTAAQVPGEPVAAYGALFSFYAVLLGISLAVYMLSRDAPPEENVGKDVSAETPRP